jgi:membrane protease YdiL (CAAX protease family)
VLWGFALYPAVVFVVGLTINLLLRAISGDVVRVPEQIPKHLSSFGVGVTLFYGILIAPIGEEFFFRGVLFRSIRDRHGFWAGALGSGVAFGLIHYMQGPGLNAVLLMCVMVFTGIGLAWIYERRGTIVAPMMAHVTFNVIGVVLIYALR